MTPKQVIENVEFHDSNLLEIRPFEQSEIAVLVIDLCVYMQPDADADFNGVERHVLILSGVEFLRCEEWRIARIGDAEILRVTANDDRSLEFVLELDSGEIGVLRTRSRNADLMSVGMIQNFETGVLKDDYC